MKTWEGDYNKLGQKNPRFTTWIKITTTEDQFPKIYMHQVNY